MNFDKIKDGVIEIGNSDKLENLLEYYKSIAFKLILTCENTVYKISEKEGFKTNLKDDSTNFLISEYLNKLFELIKYNGFEPEIDNYILQIVKLNNENRKIILSKVFYLIDNYYKFINRKILSCSNFEHFKKKLIVQYQEFIKCNFVIILNLIKDTEFQIIEDFKLQFDFYE